MLNKVPRLDERPLYRSKIGLYFLFLQSSLLLLVAHVRQQFVALQEVRLALHQLVKRELLVVCHFISLYI